MTAIRWLTRRMVEAFHQESLSRFGGASGVRDEGLLECALARPQNHAAYGDAPTIFDLAADYCIGFVRNDPFVDGNKRAGLLSAHVFLALSGYLFEPDEAVAVQMVRGLAASEVSEEAFVRWLSDNSRAKS